MYCLKDQEMRYPGYDPENGPARLSCGDTACELNLEDDADFKFKMEASIDEAWDLAEEENEWIDHMDRLYPEIENDEYFEMYDQALDHSLEMQYNEALGREHDDLLMRSVVNPIFNVSFADEVILPEKEEDVVCDCNYNDRSFDEMFITDHSKLWSPYFLGKREE